MISRGVASPRLFSIVLAALAAMLLAAAAPAQPIRPWIPPSADSLQRWASEAKVRFQANRGDTVAGSNYRAYELVGRMGRQLLRSLGKANTIQAHAIEPVLDSLGLDTEVANDPSFPTFALVMVRNPYQLTAPAVGFLYWYRENDLRMQGVQFLGGQQPQMRVWWTGRREAPYSWAIVDRSRGARPRVRFTLCRLIPDGAHWMLSQYGDRGPDLGEASMAALTDLNGDEKPELVVWMPAEADSLFEDCNDCPRVLNEVTFNERPEGFTLLDTRILPSPYTTFRLFIRALLEGNRTTASRLLKDPGKVQAAVDAGWGRRRARGAWIIEGVEDHPWPRWLIARFRGQPADRRYQVTFELHRGRWVIRDWTERPMATTGSSR